MTAQQQRQRQTPGQRNSQAPGHCMGRDRRIRTRGSLMQAGKTGKLVLGALMLLVAAMIVSGADRPVEAWLVDQSPAWLTKMTTQF